MAHSFLLRHPLRLFGSGKEFKNVRSIFLLALVLTSQLQVLNLFGPQPGFLLWHPFTLLLNTQIAGIFLPFPSLIKFFQTQGIGMSSFSLISLIQSRLRPSAAYLFPKRTLLVIYRLPLVLVSSLQILPTLQFCIMTILGLLFYLNLPFGKIFGNYR